MDFLLWYKNKVESNDLDPPEFVWENIQDELDINYSWGVINNHLAHKAAVRRRRVLAAVASILLILSLGTYWLFKSIPVNNDFKGLAKEVKVAEEKVLDSGKNKIATGKIEEANIQARIEKPGFSPVVWSKEPARNDSLDNLNSNVQRSDDRTELIYAKLDKKNIVLPKDELRIAEIERIEVTQQEELERKMFQKWYVGSTGQLANTWLLNEKTYQGLESSSLTSSNTSFGFNIGIFVGTNLFKNMDLQLDFNLLAQNNQNYNEYINGHYIENQMRFNYSQLSVSLRYYFISNRFMYGEHGINLGGYWGYLNSAYQTINGQETNLTANYNSFDYGVFLGYEYIIPIYKKLGLGTGFRAYYGLQNIYAGDEFIPAYLNKTQNASLNITLSLKYSIK